MSRPLAVKCLDLLLYVTGVVGTVLLLSVLVAVSLGGRLPLVKFLLFLIGFVLVGYGTVLLWPTRPDEDPGTRRVETVGERTPSPLESTIEAVLARAGDRFVPGERFSPGIKVFAAGCSVLLVSYLMEAVLAVGVE